jgi:hypothetical protein
MLDKSEIIKALLEVMESNLRRQFDANKNASDGATNAESRAETKWDTCGLEASYLARGHALQFKQTAAQVDELRAMEPQSFVGKQIGVGALVEVDSDGETMFFFLMNHGGGTELKLDFGEVTVVTPESPVGVAMQGKEQGNRYQLKSGLSGEIIKVY